MVMRPSRTAAQASSAMPLQDTHHCGFSTGSITSELRLHRPSRMAFPASPLNSPFSFSHSTTVFLA